MPPRENFRRFSEWMNFPYRRQTVRLKGISGDEVAISEKPHIKIVLSSKKAGYRAGQNQIDSRRRNHKK